MAGIAHYLVKSFLPKKDWSPTYQKKDSLTFLGGQTNELIALSLISWPPVL